MVITEPFAFPNSGVEKYYLAGAFQDRTPRPAIADRTDPCDMTEPAALTCIRKCIQCGQRFVEKDSLCGWQCSMHPGKYNEHEAGRFHPQGTWDCCGRARLGFYRPDLAPQNGCMPCDHRDLAVEWTEDNHRAKLARHAADCLAARGIGLVQWPEPRGQRVTTDPRLAHCRTEHEPVPSIRAYYSIHDQALIGRRFDPWEYRSRTATGRSLLESAPSPATQMPAGSARGLVASIIAQRRDAQDNEYRQHIRATTRPAEAQFLLAGGPNPIFGAM